MARNTIITYTCDGCDKPVKDSTQLRKLSITSSRAGRPQATALADLCETCEETLIAAVAPLLDASSLNRHAVASEV